MTSPPRIAALLLVLITISFVVVDARIRSPSQQYARTVSHRRSLYKQRRHLQQQMNKDNEKNNGKEDDEDEDEDDEDENPQVQVSNTVRPIATRQPTPNPTRPPSTPRPSFPPSLPPATTTQEPPPADNVWTTPGQTFTSTVNNNPITTLSDEELKNIQFFGGGEITLRFSLWFQDQTPAAQAGVGPTLIAVLHALQDMLCQSDVGLNNNLDESDPLGLNTLDWTDASRVEERELCVVPLELGGAELRSPMGEPVEGSVLLQPPTTFVVDRTASNTDLHWTTWRVTWDVLRLGTFYILQGLENAGGDTTTATLGEEEIYRAGISALQGILELALQVSIRETTFDKVLVGSMVQVDQSEGLVLASVYGEEVETLEPKLEWLGLAQPSHFNEQDELVIPTTTVTNAQGQSVEQSTTSSSTTATSTASDAQDDEFADDDRYSLTYGITETLNPDFWHPLRIVGMVMFVFTTACLVGLSIMSKRRQARRAQERKEAKEGLLNNPQSVEDMLRASHRDNESRRNTADAAAAAAATPSKSPSNTEEEEEDSRPLSIPMPPSLQVS